MPTGIYLPYLFPTDLSVKKPASNNLRTSLEQLTKNQLEIICESYSEKTFSKKADLIDYLYSTIISTCGKFFLYENEATSKFMLMFMEAANKSDGTVEAELKFPEDENNELEVFSYILNCEHAARLMKYGYIFHHEKKADVFFSVPLEICQEISKYIDENRENHFGEWENLQQFATCMLSIYGVLTVRDFGKLWKIQFPEIELSENQIIEHLSSSAMIIGDYTWNDDLKAIHYDYHDNDDVENLIDDRKRISMYLPDREQLKNWFDDFMNSDDIYMLDYLEQYEIEHNNPYYIQMIKFLEKRRKKDWDEILHYMMYYIKDGFPMSQTINELNKDFKLTESMKKKDAEQFFLIYQNLHNSAHLWINYGWSPDALWEKHLKQENDEDIIHFPRDLSMMDFQDIPKVGRNDPCPCGSGKKYKHCHGK